MRATCCRSLSLQAPFMVKVLWLNSDTHTHKPFILQMWAAQPNWQIGKSTHLESYNCRHIRDGRDIGGTESYHSLLYRIANGFVWTQSVLCRDSDVGIIADFRINYGTVLERIRQRQFAFGKIWTQSGLNRQETAMKSFSRSCPFITIASWSTGHHLETVPTTQDIVTILIRYSRICHNIVTIVIWLYIIGWVSRMLHDTPNFRECLANLSGPFPISRSLKRTYTTSFRQW